MRFITSTRVKFYLHWTKPNFHLSHLKKQLPKRQLYDAYIKLGELYLIVKEHKKSLACFSKAQEINPAEAKPYFYKGMNFKEVRDTANAIISFQRASEIDNSYFEPHLQLALLFAAKKRQTCLTVF